MFDSVQRRNDFLRQINSSVDPEAYLYNMSNPSYPAREKGQSNWWDGFATWNKNRNEVNRDSYAGSYIQNEDDIQTLMEAQQFILDKQEYDALVAEQQQNPDVDNSAEIQRLKDSLLKNNKSYVETYNSILSTPSQKQFAFASDWDSPYLQRQEKPQMLTMSTEAQLSMIDNAIKNKQKENEDNLQKYSEYQENTEYWDKKISDYYKYKSEKPGMDLTDIDTYVYKFPGLLGSSSGTMGASAAGWASSMLLFNPYTAPIGAIGLVASNLYSREQESNAEVYQAYKDKVRDQADKDGVYDKVLSNARKQMAATGSYTDDQLANDDYVLDQILTNNVSAENTKFNTIMNNSMDGIKSVYKDNMALSALDVAEDVLTVTPLGKLLGYGKKAATMSKFARNINKRIDDVIGYGLEGINKIPKRTIRKQIVDLGGRMALTSVLEGAEEGTQYMLSKDYQNGIYDEDANLAERWIDNVGRGIRSIYAALTPWDPVYSSDEEFMENFKGGAMLGGIMTGVAGSISTVTTVRDQAKQVKFNNAFKEIYSDKVEQQDAVLKNIFYATQQANNNWDRVETAFGNLKQANVEGLTWQDIEEERKRANQIRNRFDSDITKAAAERIGINKDSEDYILFTALTQHQDELVDKTKKTKDQKANAVQQLIDSKELLDYVNNLEIVRNGNVSVEDAKQAIYSKYYLQAANKIKSDIEQSRQAADNLTAKTKVRLNKNSLNTVLTLVSAALLDKEQYSKNIDKIRTAKGFDERLLEVPVIHKDMMDAIEESIYSTVEHQDALTKSIDFLLGRKPALDYLKQYKEARKKEEEFVQNLNDAQSGKTEEEVIEESEPIDIPEETDDQQRAQSEKESESQQVVEPSQEKQINTDEKELEPIRKAAQERLSKLQDENSLDKQYLDEVGEKLKEIFTAKYPNARIDGYNEYSAANRMQNEEPLDDIFTDIYQLKLQLEEAILNNDTDSNYRITKELEALLDKADEEISLYQFQKEGEAKLAQKSNAKIEEEYYQRKKQYEEEQQADNILQQQKQEEQEIKDNVADKPVTDDKIDSNQTLTDVLSGVLGESYTQALQQQQQQKAEPQVSQEAKPLNEPLVYDRNVDPYSHQLGYHITEPEQDSEGKWIRVSKPYTNYPELLNNEEFAEITSQPDFYQEVIRNGVECEVRPYTNPKTNKVEDSIYFIFNYKGKKYGAYLHTKNGITAGRDNPINRLPYERKSKILENLEALRNKIISLYNSIKNDPSKVIVPTSIRLSNGRIRNEKNPDGSPKNKKLTEWKLTPEKNPYLINSDNTKVSITTGPLGHSYSRWKGLIVSTKRSNRLGSANLQITYKRQDGTEGTLSVQLNTRTFENERNTVEYILDLLLNQSNVVDQAGNVKDSNGNSLPLKAQDVLQLIVNYGGHTSTNPNDSRLDESQLQARLSKQFYQADDNHYVIGNTTYSTQELLGPKREDVIKYMQENFHWNIDEFNLNQGSFGDPDNVVSGFSQMKSYFKTSGKDKIVLKPGVLEFDKEDFGIGNNYSDKGISALGWYVKEGILLTDAADRLYDVNIYVDDVTVVDRNQQNTQQKTAEKAAEFSSTSKQFDLPGENGSRNIFTMDDIFKILDGNDSTPGANYTVENIDGDKIDVQDATQWLSSKLGIIPEIVPSVIEVTQSGMSVVGKARIDSITLSELSPEGTQYHEAWHRVSQLLISPKQRTKILKRYTKKGFTEKQADEMLAEEFRSFMLYADSKKDTKFKFDFDSKNWFRRVFDFIRLWARTGQYGLAKVMYYTAVGKYKGIKPSQQNIDRFKQLYGEGAEMQVNGVKLKSITTEKQLDDIVKSLLYAFFQTDFANKPIDYYSLAKNKPTFENLLRLLKNTQASDPNRINPVMDEIIERFNDVIVPRLILKLKGLGIRTFDITNSKKEDIEQGADQVNVGQHTVEGMNISIKDNAPAEVKFFFQTIPVLELNNEGKLVNKLHPNTGFAQFYDSNLVWNSILKDLSGCRTISNIVSRVAQLAETDNFYKSVLNKLTLLIKQSINKENQQVAIQAEAMLSKLETVITCDVNNYLTVKVQSDEVGSRTMRVLDNGVDLKAMKYPKIWSRSLFYNSGIFKYKDTEIVATQNAQHILKTISNNIGSLINIFAQKNGILVKGTQSIDFHEPNNLKNLKSMILNMFNTLGIGIDEPTLNKLLDSKVYGNVDADEYTKLSRFITSTANYGGMSSIKHTIDQINKAIGKDGKVDKIVVNNNKEIKPNDIFTDNGFVKVLANTYAYVHASDSSLSTIGAENNTYYKVSQNNFFKDRVDELNTDLDQLNNLSSVIYNQGSIILAAAKKGQKLSVETFINFKDDESREQGRDYFGITDREDYIAKMTMILNDRIISPTIGDKKTYHVISGVKLFHEPVNFTRTQNGTLITYGQQALDVLLGYALDEYNRIQNTIDQLDPNSDKYLDPSKRIKNYHTNNSYKDKQGKKHTVEPNGTRFISFNGIYTNKGFISFNDPKLSSKDNLQKAKDYFFGLPAVYQKTLLSGIINQRVREEIQYAKELGLISINNNGDIWSIRNILLDDKVVAERTERYTQLDPTNAQAYAIWDIFSDYVIGSIISVNEIEKLFSGDPAYYKVQYDENGIVDNAVDKIKRSTALTSTGTNNRLDFFNDPTVPTEYTVAELKDHEVKSKQYDIYENLFLLGNIKETIQELEGQEAWEEVKGKSIDEISEVYPEAVKIAKQAAMSDVSGYKSGINVADAAVYISPNMYKNLMRMQGLWSKDVIRAFDILTNEATADKWESDPKLYAQANKIILNSLKYMAFGTRFRDGLGIPYFNKMALFPLFKSVATGDLKPLYDRMMDKENPLDMVMFNSAVKAGSESAQSYYEGTSDREVELKDGSTTLAAELMDIPEQRVRDLNKLHVYKQKYKYLRQQLLTDPHTHEEQMAGTQFLKVNLSNLRMSDMYGSDGDQVSGQEIKDNIMSALNRLSNIGKQKLSDKLLDSEGNVNEVAVAKMLLDDAMESDANDNIISGLKKVIEKGSFDAYPLSALSDNKWLESRFISLINKNVIDVQLPGGAFIQRSVFGVEATDSRVITPSMINDGRYLRSINDEGSMDAVVSINLLKHIIPNYDKMTFKQARQWLLDHNIIGQNAKANSIGYRIPTQSIASISPLRFVDVFPEIMGDVVMLPEDFTKLTGSDFDIDKLYIARYGYDKQGNIITDNSEDGIKNQLMQNYLRVLLTKENTSSLKLSIDIATDNVKQVLEDIEGSKQKHNVQPLEVYSPKFQEAKKSEYTGGKAGIGPFALNNAHHILTQLTKLKMASNPFTKAFDIIELGRIFDQPTAGVQKGGRILDWLSAMINAFVDIAKDPYIVRLNVNQWTYNMVSFLLRTGKGKRTFYFMSQPILKEMAEEVLKTKGKFGIDNTKTPFQLEQEAIDKVLNKYDPIGSIRNKYQYIFKDQQRAGQRVASLFETRLLDNGEETSILRELIKNPESFKEYDDYQVKVYFAWKAIKPYADSLANLVKYSKVDTKKTGKSFAAQEIYLDGMEELKQDNRFKEGEVSRFFKETFIDTKTQNSIPFGMKLFANLLIRNTGRFSKQKKAILRSLGRLTNADENSLNVVINAMESQVKAKFFNDYLAKNKTSLRDMFIGGNSIAIRLNNFKLRIQRGEFPDLYINNRYQNDFLELLLPDMGVEYGLNFISLSQVLTSDQTLDNNLINYWRELIEHPNERVSKLFKDLAIYAFYTTGDNSTINGFFKYLPNSFREELGYVQFMKEQLKSYAENSEFSDTDVEDIFLNNWQNDFLVKPVELFVDYMEEKESLKTVLFNTKDIVPGMISGEGNMSGRQLIKPIKRVKLQNGVYVSIFAPYVKIRIGNRSIENTHVYKLVGVYIKVIDNHYITIPVYGLVSKKGYKHKGYNIYEYGTPTQFDFNKEVQYNYANVIDNQESMFEYLEETEQYGWDMMSSHGIKHISNFFDADQYISEYLEEDDVDIEEATVLDINNDSNTNNDNSNFANAEESKQTIQSDRTILTNAELVKLRPITSSANPRIAVASEHTDPVFFANRIIDILDGKVKVDSKFTNESYTGSDFAALYLITKHDGLPLKKLLEYKIPKLIHFSITGLGGTKYEPGVMKYNDLLDRIQSFIQQGLDPEMVTVRIDPIIPGVTPISAVEDIIKRSSEMGIRNIRFSVMDQYSTTKKYMEQLGYDYSKYYDSKSLHARPEIQQGIAQKMLEFAKKYGVRLSTCAEPMAIPGIEKDGCLSVAAVNNMLGTSISEDQLGKQRALCSCYGGKVDLLRYDNKCASSCVYCYAHHNANANAIYYNQDGTLRDTPLTRTVEQDQQETQNLNTRKTYSGIISNAKQWSDKEGWSIQYYYDKVLPNIDQAYQVEFKLADNQDVRPNFRGQMNFDYRNDKADWVKSNTTIEAIRNGERTATTRFAYNGNMDYWLKVKVGDIIEFYREGYESVKVVVTKPFTKLQDNSMPKQLSLFDNMTEEDKQLIQQQKERQDKQCKDN